MSAVYLEKLISFPVKNWMKCDCIRSFYFVSHAEMDVRLNCNYTQRNLIKSNWNQIVFTIFLLIWNTNGQRFKLTQTGNIQMKNNMECHLCQQLAKYNRKVTRNVIFGACAYRDDLIFALATAPGFLFWILFWVRIHVQISFRFLSNWKKCECSRRFPFDYKPCGILFGS